MTGDRRSARPQGVAARATLLNGAGLLLPLLAALALLPVLARELGAARFGIFVLTWTLLDYLGYADLGFSRATTRFVAADLARGRVRAVRQRVGLAISAQLCLGALAGTSILLFADPIAARLLRAPVELLPEATALVRSAAPHVPVLLLMSGLRGALEGAQRFGVSAALRAPTGALAVAAATIAAAVGAALPVVITVVLLIRLIGLAAHVIALHRCLPEFRWEWPRRWMRLRGMLGFGGWVAISSILSPILLYGERFILAIVVGPAAAGRYSLPQEALHRLLLVPAAIAGATMPILTGLRASGRHGEAQQLTSSAARHTFLLVGPPVLLAIAFAPALLAAWLGGSAQDLVWPVRILAAGVLINALVHAPYAALLSAGRPDLPARAHLGELLLYFPIALMLVRTFGLTGAAAAWTLRVLMDGAILGYSAHRLAAARVRLTAVDGASLLLFTCLAAALFLATLASPSLTMVFALLALCAYAATGWNVALLPEERASVRRALSSPMAFSSPR